MESKNKLKELTWLNLLKEAVNDGVKIQINHRFKYKNKSLGTFLVSAKRNNKTELIEKIERLGVNYRAHSRKPEHYLENFIFDLSNDENPNKQKYTTRFNECVFPKKDKVKKETIKKLNSIWKEKFGDVRKWEKPENDIDKIKKWRKFRYNEKINPQEKWFGVKTNMGKLYSWVYTRKRDEKKMNSIIKYFNENELSELKKEGFLK